MDSDNSSYPDDHGLNMDPAPASHDNPSTNMDSISSQYGDPGTHSGPSSFSAVRGHLRCVNCGLNITRTRRHLLEIAEVRNLVQRWVRPQQVQVSSDSLVCHACWTAAWSQIRHPTSDQQNAPIVGHVHVCISCGRSLLKIRSHTLRSDSPHDQLIRNVIARQIAPREMPPSSRVCHNCWRRTDRSASRLTAERESETISLPSVPSEVASNVSHDEQQSLDTSDILRPSNLPSSSQAVSLSTGEQESEPPSLPSLQSEVADNSTQEEQRSMDSSNNILLPNYVRAPNTQNRCFFPSCNESDRHVVPSALRVHLFCDYNYYVPPDCRICYYHLTSNSWDLLLESIYNPIKTFSAAQIEDFASLLKENMQYHLDFENIQNMPEHTVHYYLGLTKSQYRQILSEVPRLANKHRGSFALAAYLIKLRTGDSDERLSALMQVPRSTLERLMNMAREILNQDFVPRNLGINHISRAEIAQRNLLIPNGLYGGEERRPIIIADGTYIYIEKSSNYLYQKKTYSLHKYRNLIKPFLFVCSDGYIIDILGPYPATTTDADIMNNEFGYESSSLRQYFEAGDVFILDRGFRDSLPLLERCGYSVHVPLSPEDGESQLSTRDANRSRAVTMCRWVVEVVNGIFKTAFKIFRQNYFNRASTHVMIDFAVAASLINKFHKKMRDRDYAPEILQMVHRNMETHNDLSDYVRQHNLNRARADFRNINVNSENVREFPILTYRELILIACGIYQLKQARSYYGEHIRFNGCYKIEVCNDQRSSIMEGINFSPNCSLLRARIASRHISRKVYFIYILFSGDDSGISAIKKYCCNCIVGRRTVGCCAHVMTVMWYLAWARHQSSIFPPAQFLDDVLIVYDTNDV